MADKLVFTPNGVHKITPPVEKRLDLINQPIEIRKKFPMLLSQRIRKCYKTLGTKEKNSPLFPLSLVFSILSKLLKNSPTHTHTLK